MYVLGEKSLSYSRRPHHFLPRKCSSPPKTILIKQLLTPRYLGTIWELLWLSGFTLIILILFLPETSSANILHRRSRRLHKLTSKTDLKFEPECMSEQMISKDITLMTLVRPLL